jgi:HK97 family phage major capsid protein
MSKLLEEKKNDLITRAEEVLNTAKAEKRELTEAEAAELAEIKADVERIKQTLMLDDDFAKILQAEKPAPVEEKKEEETVTEEQRELADRIAFENYIRGEIMRRDDPVVPTNMTKGDNGAVIPETIADKIIKRVYDISPVLERSSKYNVKGTLTIPYYDESTKAITVAYQTEFSAITSETGKFVSNVTLTGFLAGALVKVSRSLINNSQFNIVDHVIDLMADHIARFIEHELLIGTDQKVAGMSALTNSVTAASASAITADEVIKLHDKVKDRYQQNAIWIMSPATRTALRLLNDEMGRYLLQDDISSPFGTSLLGKPVYVSDNMPEIATGNAVIYYGDFKGLATKFSENINIQVLREKYADEHADGVIGWFEFDATVEDQQKLAKLVMA